MSMNSFDNLTREAISKVVKSSGNADCLVFAYDGTRRSHLIQEVLKTEIQSIEKITIDWDDYSNKAFKLMLGLSTMIFEHGVKSIIYPMWFPTLGKRGVEYYPKFIKYLYGLDCLLQDTILFQTFEKLDIRIIFYGEWREYCRLGNHQKLEQLFERLMEKTKAHTTHNLLFGINITPTTEVISNLTLDYFTIHKKCPTKKDLIDMYYGIPIGDVKLYIGFDRFVTDGRPPMISDNGDENLYFTVSPHSYFNEKQFRSILYDHLFSRCVANTKDYDITRNDVHLMNSFYLSNNQTTLGIGSVQKSGNYWYPTTQVAIPNSFSSLSHNVAQPESHKQPHQQTNKLKNNNKSIIKRIFKH